MDEVQQGPRPCSDMSEEEIDGSDGNVFTQRLEQQSVCEKFSHGLESPGSAILIRRPLVLKRPRSTDRAVNDGFVMVQGNRKKINKTKSTFEKIEVNMSSYNLLPKQIGLAKLLKSENIDDATEIKYKSSYRVLISFDKRGDAEKLLQNENLKKLGYRCHLTSEVGISYGLIRNVELEIEEEEMLKAFQCERQIVSVRRLKRIDVSGAWVKSETVRFGFKGPALPQFVVGYDCRFKVEPYTFPVTQCSLCWKFGHTARTCPNKKVVCPKCAEGHANCETTYYRCVNCKGTHMALDRSCLIYIKERKIRAIMCQNNCTYKMALAKLHRNKRIESYEEIISTPQQKIMNSDVPKTPLLSYSQSVGAKTIRTEAIIHQESGEHKISEEDSSEASIDSIMGIRQTKRRKTKKKNKIKNITIKDVKEKMKKNISPNRNNVEEQSNKNRLRSIWQKAKDIVFSEKSFEEKVQQVLKLLFEELLSFIVKSVNHGEVLTKLVGLFHNG